MTATLTAVIGIGSPHGDDRAGWLVVDRVAEWSSRFGGRRPQLRFTRAKVPHELFDQIGEVQVLHLIDAYHLPEQPSVASAAAEPVRRFELAPRMASEFSTRVELACATGRDESTDDARGSRPRLRSATSHHLDLLSVLELARTLGQLPAEVVLWAVPGRRFDPADEIDPECLHEVNRCADWICRELGHA